MISYAVRRVPRNAQFLSTFSHTTIIHFTHVTTITPMATTFRYVVNGSACDGNKEEEPQRHPRHRRFGWLNQNFYKHN